MSQPSKEQPGELLMPSFGSLRRFGSLARLPCLVYAVLRPLPRRIQHDGRLFASDSSNYTISTGRPSHLHFLFLGIVLNRLSPLPVDKAQITDKICGQMHKSTWPGVGCHHLILRCSVCLGCQVLCRCTNANAS